MTLQVIAALIAFLLARLAQLRDRAGQLTTQALFRLLQATFLQRRPLDALLRSPPGRPPPPPPNPQLALALA